MAGNSAPVMRRGALLMVGVLLIAGCSGSSSETTTSTTDTPTTAATTSTTTSTTAATTTTTTTTTTAAPATTTTAGPPDKLVSNFDRDSVDDFNTNIDDPLLAALELEDLANYLEGNPTGTAEEMVDLLVTDDNPLRDDMAEGFRELVDNNWHYIDAGARTVALMLVEHEADTAVVREASRRDEQLIADADGNIVKTYPGWSLDIGEFTIERGPDGRWRWAVPGSAEPISDGELEQMVPVEWTGRQ